MSCRKKIIVKITGLIIIAGIVLQGCTNVKQDQTVQPEQTTQNSQEQVISPDPASEPQNVEQSPDSGTGTVSDPSGSGSEDAEKQNAPPVIDLKEVKPNEAGRIMVVMFHNFVEEYTRGDKLYTTTFDAFQELLNTLYTSGYRLISLTDYLNGNIDTPAGCIPMVFTFDDGTAGQFNLIEEGSQLKSNPQTAVGILEEFNKTYPDFGTKGTFFVNLGDNTFSGAGTLSQRLEYLIGKGFEIGNHTYTHINLKETKSIDKIKQEIGGNQKKMYELVPGYTFTAFSLPYGAPSKELTQYVIKGEFEGIEYENTAIMEVGWDPAPSPFGVKFDPLSTHRVRSSGINPVDADLAWWLSSLKRENQYVSDGNPETVAVPESYLEFIKQESLKGKTLLTY